MKASVRRRVVSRRDRGLPLAVVRVRYPDGTKSWWVSDGGFSVPFGTDRKRMNNYVRVLLSIR